MVRLLLGGGAVELARAQKAALTSDHSYLDAVVVEALRVRPVLMDVARRLTRPVDIGPFGK